MMFSPAGTNELALNDHVDQCSKLIEEHGQLIYRPAQLSAKLGCLPASIAGSTIRYGGLDAFLAAADIFCDYSTALAPRTVVVQSAVSSTLECHLADNPQSMAARKAVLLDAHVVLL
jgi:hypothetical protein